VTEHPSVSSPTDLATFTILHASRNSQKPKFMPPVLTVRSGQAWDDWNALTGWQKNALRFPRTRPRTGFRTQKAGFKRFAEACYPVMGIPPETRSGQPTAMPDIVICSLLWNRPVRTRMPCCSGDWRLAPPTTRLFIRPVNTLPVFTGRRPGRSRRPGLTRLVATPEHPCPGLTRPI
jgi:hypothetical protein